MQNKDPERLTLDGLKDHFDGRLDHLEKQFVANAALIHVRLDDFDRRLPAEAERDED